MPWAACCHIGEPSYQNATVQVISLNILPLTPHNLTLVSALTVWSWGWIQNPENVKLKKKSKNLKSIPHFRNQSHFISLIFCCFSFRKHISIHLQRHPCKDHCFCWTIYSFIFSVVETMKLWSGQNRWNLNQTALFCIFTLQLCWFCLNSIRKQ